ncbi:glycoside hydrolase family 5 [Methylorubrum extorquens CM4]|uniref:Glycoside hydrolase family 5 n=1 Tax=Methylorubrum extorquens (strain CM4 / NCIMB 13688) TaxID=440085 RepID=B7L198_METC4|nr:glycoside hydrolase family 5 [Methylorubrum extorquens CM4]
MLRRSFLSGVAASVIGGAANAQLPPARLCPNFRFRSAPSILPWNRTTFTSKRSVNIVAIGFNLYGRWGTASWDISATNARLAALKALGFDAVRIAIDPTTALNGAQTHAQWWAVAQYAIDKALAEDLNVIADLHVALDGSQSTYRADQIEAAYPNGLAWAAYVNLLQYFAAQLAGYNNTEVCAEIYNENMQDVGGDWPAMAKTLWNAFRVKNLNTTVLVGGSSYSSVDGLADLLAANFDANTGYVVHDYEPGVLSHQGVGVYQPVSRLHYPPIFSEKAAALAQVLGNSSLTGQINNYFGSSQFDATTMNDGWLAAKVAVVTAWRKANGVPASRIFMTETGIHNDTDFRGASRVARLGFIQTKTRLHEAAGHSVGIWAWDGSYWALPSVNAVDADYQAALGLSGGIFYETEASALFARITIQPSAMRKALINATIKMLKDTGLWTKLDAFYMLAAADEQSARLNWKSAMGSLTKVGSPAFTVDAGFTGGGGEAKTAYLNTGIVLGTSTLFAQSSGHMGVVQSTAMTGGDQVALGDDNYNSGVGIGRYSTLIGLASPNGLTYSDRTTPDGTGHLIASRSVAGTITSSLGGSARASITDASAALVTDAGNAVQMLHAAGQMSRIAAAHFGSGLTPAEQRDLYSITKFCLLGVSRAA